MVYANKPVVIKQLFSKKDHEHIAAYVKTFAPMLPLNSDINDAESPHKFNRKYTSDPPFLFEIHKQLKEFASDIFGEKVKPSYVFLSLYENGGQCPLHIDRPQCRYTIDYLISQENDEPWPIKIGTQMTDDELAKIDVKHPQTEEEINKVISSTKWTECLLSPNDAACYSGTHSWHYRPTKSVGSANLAFFHFVQEEFDGPLN